MGGADTFLSGWGEAEGRRSLAYWACKPEDADRVLAWVRSRTDIEAVTRYEERLPQDIRDSGDHVHVYVISEGHVALND